MQSWASSGWRSKKRNNAANPTRICSSHSVLVATGLETTALACSTPRVESGQQAVLHVGEQLVEQPPRNPGSRDHTGDGDRRGTAEGYLLGHRRKDP